MHDYREFFINESSYHEIDLQKAYDVFNQSYLKATGKSWDFNKFADRARNWDFLGDSNGYVTVRPQKGGLVKLVGMAGSIKSIFKGIQILKTKYADNEVWGMVSKDIANQAERLGFKTIKITDKTTAKIFLKLIGSIIPSSVFGGAKITGVNPDGTLIFSYPDIGEAHKILIGNAKYFAYLKDQISSNDKLPWFIKNKILNLL